MVFRRFLVVLFLVIASIFVFTQSIHKPFWGHHDWNSNLWSITAKNNLVYGVECTRLGQVTVSTSDLECSELSYYMNHPPLISWLVTLGYALFGISEWAARFPIIIVSVVTVLLLYELGRSLWGELSGISVAMLSLCLPIMIYFGKAINHEPLVLMGVVWAALSSIHWLRHREKKWFVSLVLSSVWVGLSGWHGYLWYGVLLLYGVLKDRRLVRQLLVPVLILVAIFVAHQLHSCLVMRGCNWNLVQMLVWRMTGRGDVGAVIGVPFSYMAFVKQEISWLRVYFGEVVLGVSGIVVLWLINSVVRKRKLSDSWELVGLLLLFGVSVPLLFAQQAFIHDYLLIYLVPGLVLAVVGGVGKLLKHKAVLFVAVMLGIGAVTLARTGPFVQALQQSDGSRQYVRLSAIINNYNPDSLPVLIEADNFWNFASIFVQNYAYGTVISSRSDTKDSFNLEKETIESRFSTIITVDTNPVDPILLKQFEQSYRPNRFSEFVFYDLRNRVNE